jgi:hypothetical protein
VPLPSWSVWASSGSKHADGADASVATLVGRSAGLVHIVVNGYDPGIERVRRSVPGSPKLKIPGPFPGAAQETVSSRYRSEPSSCIADRDAWTCP